jgi:glycosyltransferase involved in cell wall biosynthesis
MGSGIALSVLVPSVPQRAELSRGLLSSLWRQAPCNVEILVLTDNQRRSIGHKRNDMLAMAQGDYVAFVDDDDTVTDDYVECLLGGILSGTDVVTFDVEVTLDGGPPFLARYSKDYPESRNLDGLWERLPNHLMCVRRELAVRTGFPDVGVGEDADYARRLHPLLRSEHRIGRVLYRYRYSDRVTLTQL